MKAKQLKCGNEIGVVAHELTPISYIEYDYFQIILPVLPGRL